MKDFLLFVCQSVLMRTSCCCRELRPQHRRLAEITEMIHTASLMHDDVLDESDTRRGNLACRTRAVERTCIGAHSCLECDESLNGSF